MHCSMEWGISTLLHAFPLLFTLPMQCFLHNYNTILMVTFFPLWRWGPTRAMASSFLRFLNHTRRITVGRNTLDKWSARRTDLYLTTHNTHNRQTTMPPGRIRTHNHSRRAALDRAATGTSINGDLHIVKKKTHTHIWHNYGKKKSWQVLRQYCGISLNQILKRTK